VNRVIEQITQVLERGTWIHLANDFAMDLRQECDGRGGRGASMNVPKT
jgi:hypothetical protein